MAGLFSANLLRRAGWEVEVFERVEGELAGRGAGIVVQPEILRAFARIGIDPGPTLGIETLPRRVLDRAGRIVLETECRQVHTAWERVFRLLRAAFPPERYHRGRTLARVDQGEGGVVARFEGGETLAADLVLGADGIRSTMRHQYEPETASIYAGYTAWRALVDEAALSPRTHREAYLCMAFCLPPGEQILGYPVAGPNDDLRPGHRRYNLVWYRPADERGKLRELLTDDRGVTHVGSIPPPLISRATIAAMRADAHRLLSPQFREVLDRAPRPFLQPIYDLESPRMAFGRVALVGDAAFVARPHVGGGVAKAAGDAMALAEVLAASPDDVPAALRGFERDRLPVGRRIVARGRALGAYIQPERRSAQERADAERFRSPRAVLEKTAVLDFLYA